MAAGFAGGLLSHRVEIMNFTLSPATLPTLTEGN